MAANVKDKAELISLKYHDIFDYPLSAFELIKWTPGEKVLFNLRGEFRDLIEEEGRFFFLKGRSGLVYKRLTRERIWKRKIKIAKSGVEILRFIPWINMISITGSLAMKNCDQDSDIDLLIICRKQTLWLTRLAGLMLLMVCGIPVRKVGDKIQRDKLCLNMWLDESGMSWPKKNINIYTAHEIAQIMPLLNKYNTYERFIWANRWVKDYWPNAIKVQNPTTRNNTRVLGSKFLNLSSVSKLVLRALNLIAYRMQYLYMKSKITNEEVRLNKAIFHPNDLSRRILSRLDVVFKFPLDNKRDPFIK